MAERCQVVDGAFNAGLVARAAASWPAPDWPGWLRYDTPDERKRACADWSLMPPACRELLALLALYPAPWPGAVPDLTLRGGGLHETAHLGPHLDADRHALCGLERVGNAILFLTDPGGPGGEFEAGAEVVTPKAGRLLLFTLDDGAAHGVRACDWPRRTLAMFWWGAPAAGPARRPRALFLPRPGEAADPRALRERRRRAGLPPFLPNKE